MMDYLQKIDRNSRLLLGGLTILIMPVLYLISNNLSAPFGLDRSQYEILGEIARVYHDQPLYEPMSIEHCTANYTPLYWLACGWIWKLMGPSFLTPKLVSLACTGATIWIVGCFLWRSTKHDHLLTASGAVLMLLVSVFSGFWICLIQVDALLFALTVAGFYCLTSPSLAATAAAATLLSLAALTKQTALAYVAAGLVYTAARSPRQTAVFALFATVVCGGSLAFLQWSSGGMFFSLTVTEHRGPPWLASRLLHEVWISQFLGQFSLLSLLAAWNIFAGGSLASAWQSLVSPEYAMLTSGLLVASIAQPKFGSGNNQAVIAFAGLIVCGFQGLRRLVEHLGEGSAGPSLRNCVLVIQTLALAVAAWDVGSVQVIDHEDRDRFARIENVFRSGPTVLYHFPYLSRSFGYRECGHQGSERCRWVDGQWNWSQKPDFLNVPYREQYFDHIVLCASVADENDPTIRTIRDNYSVAEVIPAHSSRPNTAMLRYPLFILTANRLAAQKATDAGQPVR